MGRDEKPYIESVYRELSSDTGLINHPMIHLDKDFFNVNSSMQSFMIYHEIGHILLHGLNAFVLDYPNLLSVRTMHSDIYKYILDKQRSEKWDDSIDSKGFSIIQEVCSDYENNETNILRRNIYFRILEIIDEYRKELESLEDNNFLLVNEFEAEIFAYMNNIYEHKKLMRYVNYEFPKYAHKMKKYYSRDIIETSINDAKTFYRVFKKILGDPEITKNLWVYLVA